MIKLSRVAIATLTVVGLVDVAAAGDPKADAKTGAPKGEAMKGDMKDADKAHDMMSKPPQEIADMAKAMTGTWKCKGQGMGHDMKMSEMNATMKVSLEMGGWWLHDTFDAKMGKEPFHFESYTSYDPQAKHWHRVMMEHGGTFSTGESKGGTAGKYDWDLTMHTMMGEMMFRDHTDASDLKTGAKSWGEFSQDKGKTWTKVYEMTCKK